MRKSIALMAVCCGYAFCGVSKAWADDRASFLNLEHFDRMGSYRMAMTMHRGGETTIQDITFVAPDREADYLPQMHQTDVSIGNRTWIRKDDGTWFASPGTLRRSVGDPARRSRRFLLRSMSRSTVTKLETGLIGGVEAVHYRFVAAPRNGHPAMTSDLWIGIGDGLPRRLTTEIGQTTMSAKFSAFGEHLTVPTPPASVR